MTAKNPEPAKLEIKIPALLAGAVTSVVVAVLASRLGVQGTLIGAAFTSLAFGLVSPFLTFGLQRSHEGLRLVSTRGRSDAAASDLDAGDTAPVVETARAARRVPLTTAVLGVAATAVLTFAATLGVLTVVEAAAGRSVDGGRGTTIGRAAGAVPAPAPTTTTPDAVPVLVAPRSATPTAADAGPTPVEATPSATPTPTPTRDPIPTVGAPNSAPAGTAPAQTAPAQTAPASTPTQIPTTQAPAAGSGA